MDVQTEDVIKTYMQPPKEFGKGLAYQLYPDGTLMRYYDHTLIKTYNLFDYIVQIHIHATTQPNTSATLEFLLFNVETKEVSVLPCAPLGATVFFQMYRDITKFAYNGSDLIPAPPTKKRKLHHYYSDEIEPLNDPFNKFAQKMPGASKIYIAQPSFFKLKKADIHVVLANRKKPVRFIEQKTDRLVGFYALPGETDLQIKLTLQYPDAFSPEIEVTDITTLSHKIITGWYKTYLLKYDYRKKCIVLIEFDDHPTLSKLL